MHVLLLVLGNIHVEGGGNSVDGEAFWIWQILSSIFGLIELVKLGLGCVRLCEVEMLLSDGSHKLRVEFSLIAHWVNIFYGRGQT